MRYRRIHHGFKNQGQNVLISVSDFAEEDQTEAKRLYMEAQLYNMETRSSQVGERFWIDSHGKTVLKASHTVLCFGIKLAWQEVKLQVTKMPTSFRVSAKFIM